VVLLDVSALLVITDIFVIASGTSRRHVLTLADEVEERLSSLGRKPLFDEPTRRYYDRERLWVDAPRTELSSAAPGT
jgi:ribosome-associated protein